MQNAAAVPNSARGFRVMVAMGRVAIFLAILALLSAWVTEFTGGTLLGWSQQHLFSDATVLTLLGIAFFLDGFLHRQGI